MRTHSTLEHKVSINLISISILSSHFQPPIHTASNSLIQNKLSDSAGNPSLRIYIKRVMLGMIYFFREKN